MNVTAKKVFNVKEKKKMRLPSPMQKKLVWEDFRDRRGPG